MADEYVGYEALIAFLQEMGLHDLDGDIVEIGAYMGGGTVKLAEFANTCGKKVYAIDTFDVSLDETVGRGGVRASDVYEAFLYGRPMLEVYLETTRGCDNVVTIIEDSMKVRFPRSQKFVFGFVDGCHRQAHVENDFRIIWPNLVPGGVVGLHDYKFEDWPEVTKAVEGLVEVYKHEIKETHEFEAGYGVLTLMLVKK